MKGERTDLKAALSRRRQPNAASSVGGAAWDSFDALFHQNPQPMWIYERETLRFLDVNEAATVKYGYSTEEFLNMTLADIRPPEDVVKLQATVTGKVGRTGYGVSEGWRHVAKDGSILHVNIHSQKLSYGDADAVLVMASDVTRIVETIDQLETQKAYFQQLFQNSPEGIVLMNTNGEVLEANEGFQKMFGYSLEELIGKTPLSLIVPEGAAESSMQSFNRTAEKHEAARLSTIRQKKNGELINVEVLAYPLKVNGVTQGVFAIYQDTTEKQRALREIEYQAHHDILTGLANRARLADAMRSAWMEGSLRPHSFLFIDLDQFKVINDTCGHSAGDEALVEISKLLKSHVRDTDLVARLGGDEFGVLLSNCNEKNALAKAEEIIAAFRTFRFLVKDRVFPVGASIGLVEIGEFAPSIEAAMTAADAACYAAKESGRGRVRVYRSDDSDIALRRSEVSWLSRLRHAIEENHFVLFFQEIHSLSDPADGIRHKEILVRYRDENGKLVPPGAFIPSAERYNLMPAIDRWVFKATCAHLQRNKGKTDVREIISINLSGTSVSDETFPEFVLATIHETGVDPRSLCFEITETAAISNLAAARRMITAFKNIGCSISLDDFGSGMSSFNYLRTLPVDFLKIDGTFIKECHINQIDYAMTEAIDHVGKILGLKTVAEFVENQEIYNKLKEIGVDYAQGYGLHVPEQWNDQTD